MKSCERAKPPVVVVTPTLGTSKYLDETMASVVSQRVAIRHILVCPAGVAAELRRRYPAVEVIVEASAGGLYAAVDRGLATLSDWEWFTYINDDDLLSPAFSDVALEHCIEANFNRIAYGDVRYIDSDGRSLGLMPTERKSKYLLELFRNHMPPLTQQGTLISRSVFVALGGLASEFKLCSDTYFFIRALLADITFQYYAREVAAYRIAAGQLSAEQSRMMAETKQIDSLLFPNRPGCNEYGTVMRFRLMNWRRYMSRIRAVRLKRTSRMFLESSRRT